MSCMAREGISASLNEQVDHYNKPYRAKPRDVPLAIQLMLYQAFDYGQRNPITANPIAFFDEWYEKKAHKLPEELRADRSIWNLWDHLMEKELE